MSLGTVVTKKEPIGRGFLVACACQVQTVRVLHHLAIFLRALHMTFSHMPGLRAAVAIGNCDIFDRANWCGAWVVEQGVSQWTAMHQTWLS